MLMWLLLLVAIIGNPLSGCGTAASTAIVTILEGLRGCLLGLPDWFFPSSSSKAGDDALMSQGQTQVDLDAIVEKLLSDRAFRDAVRDVATTEVRSARETVISRSDDKLAHLQTLLERREKEAQDSTKAMIHDLEAAFDSKLKASFDDIQREFRNRVPEGDLLAELKSLTTEKEKLELLIREHASSDSNLIVERLAELEGKISGLTGTVSASEASFTKCCKSEAILREEMESIFSTLLDGVTLSDPDSPLADDLGSQLKQWMEKNFVTSSAWKSDWERTRAEVQSNIDVYLQEAFSELRRNATRQSEVTFEVEAGASFMTVIKKEITRMIDEALRIYDADKTGMFDYALESAGGTIASTRCTETHDVSNAVYSVFGVPFWWERSSPRIILQPGSSPGQCWAFKGSNGAVVVRLSSAIVPRAVTLEHISKKVAPDQSISSAPKDISILGLRSVDDENPISLGNFTYVDNDDALQTFFLRLPVSHPQLSFQLIELKILSNHGNLLYTCLYRFRVHGDKIDQ